MAQGRVKRLQSQARSQPHAPQSTEPTFCELCDRPVPPALRDAHHLVPKSRGGSITVFMHRACHRQVHALFTETELARHYPTGEALRAHPEIGRFIDWLRDKPYDFNPPTRRSRSKGRH
jgi:hypothetical protein